MFFLVFFYFFSFSFRSFFFLFFFFLLVFVLLWFVVAVRELSFHWPSISIGPHKGRNGSESEFVRTLDERKVE